MKHHTLQWFIDRIGKRTYRQPSKTCDCKECQRGYVDIWDGNDMVTGDITCRRDFHAQYIYDCQNELGIEYFDKPIKEKK
jgi:hypothetical protein